MGQPLLCRRVWGNDSDYYWYEVGDVICIGDTNALYYCFPKDSGDVVAKTRLAAEELYKIVKEKKAINRIKKTDHSNFILDAAVE